MDLLKDLCKLNAEILGEAHSEMLANMEKVEIILDFEHETLKQLELDGQKLWPKLVKDYPKVIYILLPAKGNSQMIFLSFYIIQFQFRFESLQIFLNANKLMKV